MEYQNYLVVTTKKWNIKSYNDVIRHYPGKWYLITELQDFTVEKVDSINPKYIFFPHWSHIVPKKILNLATCVCFHGTDLPYGRGGSPLQNLITRGHTETVISALIMSEELDSGPILLKKRLSLHGLAEEIYIRSGVIVAEMIKTIIEDDLQPNDQIGETTLFKRRKPSQSEIPVELPNFIGLFNHIRMLDAESYPRAFFERGNFRYEISRPSLKTDEIVADVRIARIGGKSDDPIR
jgi:methionyl-tRNA formyltransferase